jgi:hypothetical protein
MNTWIMYKPDVYTASYVYSEYEDDDTSALTTEDAVRDYYSLCAKQPEGSCVSLYVKGKKSKESYKEREVNK